MGSLSEKQRQELVEAIKATSKNIGINPVDLATAISYETGGTFAPWKRGPTTKWGQHRGLIQWGVPQRRRYGVTQNTSITHQVAAAGQYLVDSGVRPGHGLLDIYSAINAGAVGRHGARDAAAGGAPGTVADKVNNQMAGHKRKAVALLGGKFTPAPSKDDVKEVQTTLNRAGYNVGPIDGIIGKRTSGAIMAFQGLQNISRIRLGVPQLDETGELDEPTFAALSGLFDQQLGPPIPKPRPNNKRPAPQKSREHVDAISEYVLDMGRMRKGDNDESVAALQRFLNEQGITDDRGMELSEDGVFGRRTRQAVKNFQARYPTLSVDGVVGRRTLMKMFSGLPVARQTPDASTPQAPDIPAQMVPDVAAINTAGDVGAKIAMEDEESFWVRTTGSPLDLSRGKAILQQVRDEVDAARTVDTTPPMPVPNPKEKARQELREELPPYEHMPKSRFDFTVGDPDAGPDFYPEYLGIDVEEVLSGRLGGTDEALVRDNAIINRALTDFAWERLHHPSAYMWLSVPR